MLANLMLSSYDHIVKWYAGDVVFALIYEHSRSRAGICYTSVYRMVCKDLIWKFVCENALTKYAHLVLFKTFAVYS